MKSENYNPIEYREFSNREYAITITVYDNGLICASAMARRYRIFGGRRRWTIKNRKKFSKQKHIRILLHDMTKMILVDDAYDYPEYPNMMNFLQYSHCARNWVKKQIQPAINQWWGSVEHCKEIWTEKRNKNK